MELEKKLNEFNYSLNLLKGKSILKYSPHERKNIYLELKRKEAESKRKEEEEKLKKLLNS